MSEKDEQAAYNEGFVRARDCVLVKIRQALALPGVQADPGGPADTVLKMLGNEVVALEPSA